MKTRHWHTTIMLALVVALTTDAAVGQGFPSKLVRLVVPFPPSGALDTVGRALAPPLSRALGQSVVVDNRPGASTVIGTEIVARARPGQLAYAIPGSGTPQHLIGEMLELMNKIDIVHVPYQGGPPAATPQEAINRLSAEIVRAVQLPEVKDRLFTEGISVAPMGPGEYDAFIRAEIQKIQKIVREANLKLD